MATYEPPADLLRMQLDSIREQTHGNWVCVISDDCSSDESFARLRELTDGDDRFAVSRSPERLGFYRNFERALSMAPPAADFVAYCDQDDRWHPNKLERLLGSIGDAQLVYSDARIVSPDGSVVRPSYWTERRNNYTNFASLLIANSVTGAASLFRRERCSTTHCHSLHASRGRSMTTGWPSSRWRAATSPTWTSPSTTTSSTTTR